LQLLFYLTPILYSIELVPVEWHGVPLRAIIERLPLAEFVLAFRDLTYGLAVPSPTDWGLMLAWAGAALGLAVVVYRSRGQDVGEFA
jgi:ABC-type polysaccharide/polyol phosphate export permease